MFCLVYYFPLHGEIKAESKSLSFDYAKDAKLSYKVPYKKKITEIKFKKIRILTHTISLIEDMHTNKNHTYT